MQNRPSNCERNFSIELKSKAFLKNIVLANHSPENVLIEGTIGVLISIDFFEGILQISGSKGTLTLDIVQNEIENSKG